MQIVWCKDCRRAIYQQNTYAERKQLFCTVQHVPTAKHYYCKQFKPKEEKND